MTAVHIDLRYPNGTPARGSVDWTPTTRYADGTTTILPAQVRFDLVNGEVTAEIPPSGPGWVYRVDENVPYGATRWVTVPDQPAVEYTALVDLDPCTLEEEA